MNRHQGNNVAEKQRQRSSIDDQIRRYLEQGGAITVVEPPSSTNTSYRGSTWDALQDLPDGYDGE